MFYYVRIMSELCPNYVRIMSELCFIMFLGRTTAWELCFIMFLGRTTAWELCFIMFFGRTTAWELCFIMFYYVRIMSGPGADGPLGLAGSNQKI